MTCIQTHYAQRLCLAHEALAIMYIIYISLEKIRVSMDQVLSGHL